MRKLVALLLVLMMTAGIALACDQTFPADPEMLAELLPGYTHIDSIDDGDVLRLLMRNAENELVFIGGVKAADGTWRFTESTPLPEGTILGVSNFNYSLGFPSTNFYDCVSVKPYADGTWGVSMFMPDAGGMIFLEKHMVYDGLSEVESSIGDHPWSDITVIDWASLPMTEAEALAQLDRSGWAVVNNPKREDRLHLRAAPDADTVSYGKYYNRTPVRIREYGEEWCAVTVCGLDGWMMTRYLTFGADMDAVVKPGPWLAVKEHLDEVRLYERPRADSRYVMSPLHGFYVMGVAGDYYHVWLPSTEEYGYVHMDDLWEGNG